MARCGRGKNDSGQLGDGTTTQRTNPVQVTHADGTGLNGVVGISTGSEHTVYLKSDGTLWAAGRMLLASRSRYDHG